MKSIFRKADPGREERGVRIKNLLKEESEGRGERLIPEKNYPKEEPDGQKVTKHKNVKRVGVNLVNV